MTLFFFYACVFLTQASSLTERQQAYQNSEMAAAIAVLRKINERKIAKDEADEECLPTELTSRLPPKELWVEEHLLGILVLG